jgi:hypothetical protein
LFPEKGTLFVGKATLLIVALNPAATTLPSDVNRMVSGPVVDVITGGKVAPPPLYKTVPPVPTPSKIVTKSQQLSVAKALNVNLTACPPAVGLIVVKPFALFA